MDDVNPRGKDQARSQDDTVIGPEHRSSQPPDAFYEVDFRVQVKTLMDARVLSATAMQTL